MTQMWGKDDLYVSPQGNDQWSGMLAVPNAEGTDGPLATIAGARDVVRRRKEAGELAGPVTVWLRGGRYPLAAPLVFGPEDSGPITYAAYPGEEPVLDGGVRIEGWQPVEVNGVVAWVAEVPEVAAGKWYFRELFVNGQRRRRPRLPKEGFYWMANVPGLSLDAQLFEGSDTFQCVPGDIKPWRNLTDVEVMVLHYWVEERMPIAQFDPATHTVVSSRRSIFALKDDARRRYAKYYVENVFEALCEPGEWYLDRSTGKVYYVPMPGETPQTVEVYAPRVEQLLLLQGAPDEHRYVEYLRFQGLTFRHADWRQPSGGGEKFGRPGIDFAAAPQAAFHVPGVIRLEGARYCAIEDCVIEHVGWYGVELADGCQGNRLVGNSIHDLGAGGVKLNGSDAQGPLARRTGNNRITDNHIYDGGHVFPSAIGVLLVHSFGNTVAHNHIHDFYYSGISCGWVWGYRDSVTKDNRIEKNHIHHLGKGLLSDMGGIYTLGVQPGTVLRGNLIHDVKKWNYGGWGIYLDEGSSHILVENNIAYNTNSQPFRQHYGRENVVRNNIWAFGEEAQVGPSRPEEHVSYIFERNIVITNGQPLFLGDKAWTGGLDRRTQKVKIITDLNLFWDVGGKELYCANMQRDAEARQVILETLNLAQWQALGRDTHSIVADPKCKDLAHYDFTLVEDSPALALGFKPIDMSDVGPRPKERRG